MTTTDKREHRRISSLNLLSYACVDENGNVVRHGMGRTLDVSENGILLETHAPLDSQWGVSLTIGLGEELIDIHGKVVRSKKNAAGKFECGIEFTEKNERALRILDEYTKAFREQED
jgi:hypothetical protein